MKKKRQVIVDVLFLAVSVGFAVYIAETGIAHELILSLGSLKLLGVLLAGMFFTSVFTTAPAIILLGQFGETTPLWLLAPIGGFGAMLGDYLIFRFVKDRVSEDFKYLFSFAKRKRFQKIFKTKLFHFFVSFVGAVIIASPLPDELGVALLGLSKVRPRVFLAISFLFNAIGILVIGLVARSIV